MERLTVLKPTRCDLKQLPLSAREAFVLSQLDGQLTLDEIAEVAGVGISEMERVAQRLLDLGAVTVIAGRGKAAVTITEKKDGARTSRVDPRAERMSLPKMERVRVKSDPRIDRVSLRPSSSPKKSASFAPRRPPSRKSLRMQKAASGDEPCELDAERQAAILALDAHLDKVDFYEALDIPRDADKKAVKRAYFAFAAKYHPDRFFGKKLGKLRPAIDRIFKKVTLANDTLLNPNVRAMYDATLPPAPLRTPPPRASVIDGAPVSTRSSKAPAAAAGATRSSKAPSATNGATKAPARKSTRTGRISSRRMKAVKAPSTAKLAAAQAAADLAQRSAERLRQLHTAAKETKLQQRIEMLLQAAEEALKTEDVIGAANNYRLALEHREDPYVRSKLDDIDAKAKTLRATRAMTLGRTAEREQRWSDAAMHYSRGFEAKPTAELADRAANALLRCNDGETERAVSLAEKAVALDPKNASYRITLGEAYLMAGEYEDAKEEADDALELGGENDKARAKALAAMVAKKMKSARG